MSDRAMPVSGPHRIYVDATSTGAALDINDFLETFLLGLVRDHGEELAELIELDQAAQHQLSHGNDDSQAGHERDARIQDLVQDARVLVYGSEVAALANALHEVARPKGLPGQRQAGAA
jgi:hypothetical protein